MINPNSKGQAVSIILHQWIVMDGVRRKTHHRGGSFRAEKESPGYLAQKGHLNSIFEKIEKRKQKNFFRRQKKRSAKAHEKIFFSQLISRNTVR
jgi:hypothetical protein